MLKLIQLAIDCNKIKEDTPGISDKKAAGVIKNRYRDRYKYATAEMMRQRQMLMNSMNYIVKVSEKK